MKNKRKQKRRLGRSIADRRKEIEKEKLEREWRNYWVMKGILKG